MTLTAWQKFITGWMAIVCLGLGVWFGLSPDVREKTLGRIVIVYILFGFFVMYANHMCHSRPVSKGRKPSTWGRPGRSRCCKGRNPAISESNRAAE